MKRSFLLGLATLTGVLTTRAVDDTYINDGLNTFDSGGPVNALNFINNGQFIRTNNFVNGPYYTVNTLNFSNRNSMIAKPGFRFDTSPESAGTNKMALNFVNAGLVNPTTAKISGDSTLRIWASNIVNRGSLSVQTNGVLSVKGENVDLAGGTISAAGYRVATNIWNMATGFQPTSGGPAAGNGGTNDWGIFDEYWGFTVRLDGNDLFDDPVDHGEFFGFNGEPFQSALVPVESLSSDGSLYELSEKRIVLDPRPNTTYFYQMSIGPSADPDNITNLSATIVFLANSNNATIPADIRFQGWRNGGDPYVWEVPALRWTATVTNRITGATKVNHLYLWDFHGLNLFSFLQEHPSTNTLWPKSTYMPDNYQFFRELKEYPNNTYEDLFAGFGYDSSILFGDLRTMSPSFEVAYKTRLEPNAILIRTNLPGASVTNMLGRTEISASKKLDLTRTKLDTQNYLVLNATNHFVGSDNAQITAPYSDIFLTSTNGRLAITNLLQPLPTFRGEVSMWSSTFSMDRVTFLGDPLEYRMNYHILIVDARLEHEAKPMVNDMKLKSVGAPDGTNEVIIGSALNIKNSLIIDAERLTLTKTVVNNAGVLSTNDMGELNLVDPVIVWTNSLPRLKYLTNNGKITTVNVAYFGGSRRPPYYNNQFDEPYEAFVNTGLVQADGIRIWSKIFNSSGSIISGSGPLSINADTALIAGTTTERAILNSTNGDLTITGNACVISNSSIAAGRGLIFSVANQLTDGGTNGPNFWSCNDGVHLLVKPAISDLLGTTLTNKSSEPFGNVYNTWSASDLGAVPEGYTNNAALGRLVLDANQGAFFTFQGTAPGQAMYVDSLVLENYATNYLSAFNFTNDVAYPITLYFASATGNGVPIADKLNNTHGGHLRWVTNFAGPNSAIPVTLRNGTVIQVSYGIRTSSTMDSDADGIVNNLDSFPFDGPNVVPSLNPGQPNGVSFSWNAAANTAYTIESSTNLISWQFVTNVVSGPVAGVMTIQDPTPSQERRFYRVRYTP